MKFIDGPGGAAVSHAAEHVEYQRAGDAGDGGHKSKGHAPDHLGNAFHGLRSVADIQPAQAPHEADEGAQDAKGGEQAWHHLRQLLMPGGIDHRIVVDIIPHVAV